MAIYDKQRLTHARVDKYLLDKFPRYNTVESTGKHLIEMTPFLQSNFGDKGDGDCTLCSIMTWAYYYTKKKIHFNLIYSIVREYAKDYFYTNNLGTIPFFARTIFNKSLKALDVDYKIKSYYLKNIGFNLGTIKKSLDKNIPVMFSITSDGRNYYKTHSITIIGYETFKLEKEGMEPKEITMLITYDNWSAAFSYVDYDKVSILSSIYC